MQKIIPARLRPGDEIRVIAPASGIKIIGRECREIARRRFEEMGLAVSYGTNAVDENWDAGGSTTVEKRTADIAEAFADPKVKAVFTMIGGNNSNQLLDFVDYRLIAENPKIFCGFSDITALLNAVYAKTGLVTFSGPHFSSLGMLKGIDYTLQNMKKMLFEDGAGKIRIRSARTYRKTGSLSPTRAGGSCSRARRKAHLSAATSALSFCSTALPTGRHLPQIRFCSSRTPAMRISPTLPAISNRCCNNPTLKTSRRF